VRWTYADANQKGMIWTVRGALSARGPQRPFADFFWKCALNQVRFHAQNLLQPGANHSGAIELYVNDESGSARRFAPKGSF